jgi:protein-S-isoprenylcysteine O-methyltransferase Ste14
VKSLGNEPPTVEGAEQGPAVEETAILRASAKIRKFSQYFGWPMLLLLLVAPGERFKSSAEFGIYALAAVPVAFCALWIRLWSRGYVRNMGFVVNGPYRYVRNPVELGSLLGYVAAGVALKIPAYYLLPSIALAMGYMSFTAVHYEREMTRKMGRAYLKYSQKVRRWFPLGLPATNSENQDYLLTRAMAHEGGSLLWILGWMAVLALRQQWR